MASNIVFAGSIPYNYETYLGPIFFEPYAVDLVERIRENNDESILELACGTGRVTKHLIKLLLAHGTLTATDLNDGMLQIAKQSISDSRIQWLVADAHTLPFADLQFDLVVCQFGVMFFGDKPKAFSEVLRVLKPNGQFVFNTWHDVPHNALANLTEKALQEIFPRDAPSFFMQGPHSFYDTDVIKQLLADAGFVQIKIEKVKKTSVASTHENAVEGILHGTPLNNYLKERSEEDKEVQQRLRKLLVEQFGEKNLELPMEAFICEATKPAQ